MSTKNRLGNCHNRFQGPSKRVLTVCSAGLLRSPTAAWVLSNDPWNFNCRAAGYSEEYALVLVDQVLLTWADAVVCMDETQKHHLEKLLEKFDMNKPVHNLHLEFEDDYEFRDPELVKMMSEKFRVMFPVREFRNLEKFDMNKPVHNLELELEDDYDFSDYMGYTEISGTKVKIPIKTLLRLHSIFQFEVERSCGRSFEEFCNSVMSKKDET